MLIEMLAVETSGLDPEKDHVLEWAAGRYDTRKRSCTTDHGYIIPPKDYQFSPEILTYHAELLPELFTAETSPMLVGPAHLRVMWSKAFCLPFLAPDLQKLYGPALDGQTMLNLWCARGNREPHTPRPRALAKVENMALALHKSCKE